MCLLVSPSHAQTEPCGAVASGSKRLSGPKIRGWPGPCENADLPGFGCRGCYELATSRAAFLSMRQTKATMCRSATVLAYRS